MNVLQSPSSNFNAVRDGRNSPDFYFDLNLGTVFDSVVNIAGNSLYADANPSDGVCTVYFQDTASDRSPTPFYVSPGFIARIPFTQIRVKNTQIQPGKKLRIVYGTDTDFQPGSVAQVGITNAVTPISETRGLAGQCYVASLAYTAAAAEYAQHFLHNPAGSGIYAFANRVTVFNDNPAARRFQLGFTLAATVNAGGTANMLGSQPPSAILSRTLAVKTIPFPNTIYTLSAGAYETIVFELQRPAIVEPGYSFGGVCTDVNTAAYFSIDFDTYTP